MSHKQLTESDIKHLADLSALKLTEQEVKKLKDQFEETLKYIENLSELNSQKATSAHISQQKNVFFEDGTKCDRSLSRDEAMANGKHKEKGYFVVDKIL